MKARHRPMSTALLLLAVHAGMTACQSKPGSPAATDALLSAPGRGLGIASVPNLRDLYLARTGGV